MRIVRYGSLDAPQWGIIENEVLYHLEGSPFAGASRGREVGALADSPLLAPVAPSKVVCIGRNYAAHAAELGNEVPPEPLIFLKAPSSIIGPEATIVLPPQSERVEHEGELALVIGTRCRHLTEQNAMAAVLGYTCANDVTARDIQRRENQWGRGKNFDTFCPIGPWIVTADEFDPVAVRVTCTVNGEVRQDGTTDLLIYPLTRLLCDITAVMTLEPGDMILTGTPAGVGTLVAGDIVEVTVEGIGTLRNRVGN